MLTLLTSDLHLTDRPNDAYRWDFLSKWLWGIRFDSLVILGDLTEEKDCHSSVLVNGQPRLCGGFQPVLSILGPSSALLLLRQAADS